MTDRIPGDEPTEPTEPADAAPAVPAEPVPVSDAPPRADAVEDLITEPNLEALVEEAQRLDLYTNLITSGIPLPRERLARFRALGLD